MDIAWTAEQAEAITAEGDTLLSASAGTGKTTTIVGKVLWRIGLDVGRRADDGSPIRPCPEPCGLDRIAAITFTEKAAHDLKRKLREAIDRSERAAQLRWELERATVGTIHGFCAELLREHALRLDVDPTFRILDEREAELQEGEVVRDVIARALGERDPGAIALIKRHGLTGWTMAPGAVDRVREVMRDLRWRARAYDAWSVPLASGAGLGRAATSGGAAGDGPPGPGHEDGDGPRRLDLDTLRRIAVARGHWSADDAAVEEKDASALELADALYRLARFSVREWLAWLESENARDFDSLILDVRRLLTRPATRPALEAIRSRFRLLIVDEFQDTDRAQWTIANAIAGIGEEPVPAAGDRPQLFVVGDPKQSIYRFRGADIGVWNEARDALAASGRPLELSWNFRSEPRLVEYVNRVGEAAIGETAAALAKEGPDTVVRYQPLRGARTPSTAAGLEWLAVEEGGKAKERREEEARRVASRVHELIGRVTVVDPDDESPRPCRARDIAVLARRNDDLSAIEPALRAYGIRFYNSATGGLADQQEVLDLVTALRLVDNPFDDLRAFAYLRSPFVGLRDEVLARIGLDRRATGPGSFLERAESFLAAGDGGAADWFTPPEGSAVVDIEREALERGLAAVRDAQALVDRADHAELLESLLERTGYRLHLLVREGAAESLANIERFIALLEQYRHLPLGRFLALWDRWGEKDLGIPQARLFSSGDDVVTLSTIHTAKGLEWPIVFLIGTGASVTSARRLSGAYWSDRDLGPVFAPNQADRGPRAAAAVARRVLEERAEEARLLYVAATRARDRLVVCGPATNAKDSFAAWLGIELADAVEEREAPSGTPASSENGARPASSETRRAGDALAEDETTRTGSQIDAFGLDAEAEDGNGQLNFFTAPAARSDAARAEAGAPAPGADLPGAHAPEAVGQPPMIIYRRAASIQTSLSPLPVSLDWLEGIEPAHWPDAVREIELPPFRLVSSATELMLRERDPRRWSRRYEHGVLLEYEFAPRRGGEPLPAQVRGTLIHGVLERIRHAEELDRILDETIAALELSDLEDALDPGSSYREALEREIERVVRSPEWTWYTEGTHYKELRFLRRDPDRGWIQGAFDLYRPPPSEDEAEAPQVSLFAPPEPPHADDATRRAHLAPWVIDFKTHEIGPDEVDEVCREYEVQTAVYREAASALASPGGDAVARVALHFTRPNVVREA